MADSAETAPEATQITFKVKSSGDKTHVITMADSATVLDLKTKLAGSDFEDTPIERQRLIYSGRVMKNDDALSVYKIKNQNTIHMVKSAPSNPAPALSASSATPPAVPQNMAAGASANNLLAGLTGARFAGHANLPSRDLFGADGGMGAPPSEDQVADMLSNPAIAQTMNEALSNPAFVDHMIQSNPMLAQMPNARELLQSPYFRNMMTNPEAIRQAARLRRMMGGQGGGAPAFPAPGVTDTTPDAAGSGGTAGDASQANPFAFPPGLFGAPGGDPAANPFAALFGQNPFGVPPVATGTAATPATSAQPAPAAGAREGTQSPAGGAPQQPANPFAALFGGAAPGAQGGSPANAANPFGLPPITPEAMQQMMQMWGGASPAAPPDNRPPEERYAEQLRQLNDMGFFDFDRNVAALRRSGGSVQGAIEHLLNGS
jgi:ubiquilin